MPFEAPKVKVTADIVYPNISPLSKIAIKTIGKPITVVPATQIITANIMLFFIEVNIKLVLLIFCIPLNLVINSFKYVVISEDCVSVVLFIIPDPQAKHQRRYIRNP